MHTQDVLRLSVIVPDGEPPTEFRICTAGTTDTTQGPYLFDEVAAAFVLQGFAAQANDLMIDYEHKSLDAMAPAGAGKAAGWFRPEVRGGELWATDVRWTEDAAASLRKREWRYFSPAFLVERESGRVVALINVALTNIPSTMNMEPLMASRAVDLGRPEDPTKVMILSNVAMLALLGLSSNASDKEVADEVTALKALAARCKEVERTLLSTTAADTVDKAIGIVLGWKASADQLATVQAKVRELEAEGERRERETLLAKHARKFTPALKEWAKTQTLDALKGFVASAPDVPGMTEPATRARTTDATEIDEPSVDLGGKKWEELSPKQKHALHFSNRPLYDALKRDHERRVPV